MTTVYEEGGGRPSVRRTSTRTSSSSPPPPHHAEDVAVAERVDVADAREKKDIKTVSSIQQSDLHIYGGRTLSF